MALCLRPGLNPLINLVTYRSCQELRVRNEVDQVVPGHGRCIQGRVRNVVGQEERNGNTYFLLWVRMVNSDPTHFSVLKNGQFSLIVLKEKHAHSEF